MVIGWSTCGVKKGKQGTCTFLGYGTPAPTMTQVGQLPAGVTFSAAGVNATLTVSAKTASGSKKITIKATNAAGTASQDVTIQVQ